MIQFKQLRPSTTRGFIVSLAAFATLSVAAAAQQQATVEGMVTGRMGSTMSVQTADSPRVIVVLQDNTKAIEKGGLFGWGHKDLAITELTPGLAVKVDGTYDNDHKLVASKVEFSKSSLKTAHQIDAGLNPVNGKLAAQDDQLRSDRRDLDAQGNVIEQHGRDIADTKSGLAANVQVTGQNTAAIGHTNDRIGQLDNYETKDSLTISFRNGVATIAKADQEKLTDFVKQVADLPGSMLEVQGFASKVGNPAANQKLSSERAENVLTVIQQSGSVPLTRILAPAAMGTTNQVADNHSRKGQAENRRVIVTILVNKGISTGADASASTPAATSDTAANGSSE